MNYQLPPLSPCHCAGVTAADSGEVECVTCGRVFPADGASLRLVELMSAFLGFPGRNVFRAVPQTPVVPQQRSRGG